MTTTRVLEPRGRPGAVGSSPRPGRARLLLLVAAGLVAGLLVSPAAAEPTITTRCDLPIAMSDGVVLRGNLRHADGVRVPTILTMTGYGKDNTTHFRPCDQLHQGLLPGYAILIVDERGTGGATGAWDLWGSKTQRDYGEVLDWIQQQPWSDGSVGVTGGSYMGITSLLVAEADARRVAAGKPEAVKAVWADVPMSDMYRDIGFHGGNPVAFYNAFLGLQSAQTVTPSGMSPDAYALTAPSRVEKAQNVVAFSGPMAAEVNTGGDRAYDSDFYRLRSPVERAHEIGAAVAVTGGWYDIFQRGQPLLAEKLTGARDRLWFQGPNYHGSVPSALTKQLGYDLFKVRLAWWDHWLRGVDNGVEAIPEVNVYTMGGDRWAQSESWPLTDVRYTPLFLDGGTSGSAASLNDGTLGAGTPGGTGTDLLPASPFGGVCDRSTAQWTAAGVTAGTPCDNDNRHAERTALTYTTAPLTEEVEVTGPITAQLWAALDRPDATLVVTVSDVAPDGTSMQVTQGVLNASMAAVDESRSLRAPCPGTDDCGPVEARPIVRPFHPFSASGRAPVPTGEVRPYLVEVLPVSQAFAVGHRLRVTVSTADVPHMTPTAATASSAGAGTVTVHRGGAHASHVLLPLRPVRP